MKLLLFLIFFLSGGAALIFETVWFSLAGLTLGNAVWSSSIVLGAFMGGIAGGNYVAGRYGHRLRRPIRFYGLLELCVGILGFGLVLLFPLFNNLLTPLFQPVLDKPFVLNALRLGISFVLLLFPTIAMGATLPVMIRGLRTRQENFGRWLGLLYGCNTMGALAGVVAAELFLIELMGIRGTGLTAAGINVFVSVVALLLSRTLESEADRGPETEEEKIRWDGINARAGRILLAAFISGGLLLALEVVWFRFMQLFIFGSTMNFAIMLGVVLAGIGLGGIVGSAVLKWEQGDAVLPVVALLSGCLVIGCYVVFTSPSFGFNPGYEGETWGSVTRGLRLMLPVSLLSGIMFTLMGHRLRRLLEPDTRAVGMLTFANTTGAMLGALAAGLLLLPKLGMEKSFFVLAIGYGGVALLCFEGQNVGNRVLKALTGAAGVVFIAAAAFFPLGHMERSIFPEVIERFKEYRIVATREALTETIIYVVRDRWDEPVDYRLVTNGHSMSATAWQSKRYMKLYVYMAVALHPEPKKALLISYGVGATAKALTDTAELEQIDIVDISRDIVEMSEVVFPGDENPVLDPRVRVHIEDGRFYLQTTKKSFDIITGEPPPPMAAGMANLYSKEYFKLGWKRLNPGGILTYWLPVAQMPRSSVRSVVAAFCEVFEDCSLWTGSGTNGMLVGIKEGGARVTEERFRRQWKDPVTGPEMRALGFELPEQLGALFLDDSPGLQKMVEGSAPLTDDFPYRLWPKLQPNVSEMGYEIRMEPVAARERFRSSAHIRRYWPEELLQKSLPYFDYRMLVDTYTNLTLNRPKGYFPENVHGVLTQTRLESLPLWILSSNMDKQRVVRAAARKGVNHPMIWRYLAYGSLASRSYSGAANLFLRALQESGRLALEDYMPAVYSLLMANRRAEAEKLLQQYDPAIPDSEEIRRFRDFLRDVFAFPAAGRIPP